MSATTYPADAEDGETPDPKAASALDEVRLLARLKRWYKQSVPAAQQWREDAREDYGFPAGHQWTEREISKLQEENRPVITLGRIGPIIDVISGLEINGRQDITCKQRGLEDTGVAECGTALVKWGGDQCDAEDEHTDAFVDLITAGMGWVEVRVDDVGDLRLIEARVDPFEMVWDCSATDRRNLEGARYVFRAKSMDYAAAKEMFPDKTRSEMHASWTNDAETTMGIKTSTRRPYSEGNKQYEDDDDEDGEITIVEEQWREIEEYGEITHGDGRKEEVKAADLEEAVKRLAMVAEMQQDPAMVPQGARTGKRWCAYQAFIGREILAPIEKLPTDGMLSYQCMTGKYDRKTKTHYGVVRPCKDPQRWANKWLSSGLNILDRGAKDTVLYEQGAFGETDHATVKSEWSQPGSIMEVAAGALTNSRIQRQQGPAFPAGYYQAMEMGISAIRDASGVNQETLGLMTRDQAGVLENQRKQQTMNVLALYFDNKTRMHKNCGQLRLAYLTSGIFPEEDLAQAVGPELSEPVPPMEEGAPPEPSPLQKLLADSGKAIRFDLTVDEAPTSVNAKERNWVLMQPMLQMLLTRQDIPNEVYLAIMEHSPLPGAVFEKLKKALENSGPSEEEKAKQAEQEEIAKAGAVAKVDRDKAAAEKDHATAQKTMVEAGRPPEQPAPPEPEKMEWPTALDEANATKAHADAEHKRVQTARLLATPIEDPNVQRAGIVG